MLSHRVLSLFFMFFGVLILLVFCVLWTIALMQINEWIYEYCKRSERCGNFSFNRDNVRTAIVYSEMSGCCSNGCVVFTVLFISLLCSIMAVDFYQVVMCLTLKPASQMNQMAAVLLLIGSGQKLLENVCKLKSHELWIKSGLSRHPRKVGAIFIYVVRVTLSSVLCASFFPH